MSPVKVTASAEGHVIIPSKNNPLFGYIRIEQERMILDQKESFMNSITLSVLVKATLKNLRKLDWVEGQHLPGNLYIVESLEPFGNDFSKDLKRSSKDGPICKVGDSPIYRKVLWDQTGKKVDQLIEHTNKEEIRLANFSKTSEDEEGFGM